MNFFTYPHVKMQRPRLLHIEGSMLVNFYFMPTRIALVFGLQMFEHCFLEFLQQWHVFTPKVEWIGQKAYTCALAICLIVLRMLQPVLPIEYSVYSRRSLRRIWRNWRVRKQCLKHRITFVRTWRDPKTD